LDTDISDVSIKTTEGSCIKLTTSTDELEIEVGSKDEVESDGVTMVGDVRYD